MPTDSQQTPINPTVSFSNPWPAMPASLEARSYDSWHIDLHEHSEIAFWLKHLGCEESALRDAVFDVGSRVGAVRTYLAVGSNSAMG